MDGEMMIIPSHDLPMWIDAGAAGAMRVRTNTFFHSYRALGLALGKDPSWYPALRNGFFSTRTGLSSIAHQIETQLCREFEREAML